jgi:hypothetical protein
MKYLVIWRVNPASIYPNSLGFLTLSEAKQYAARVLAGYQYSIERVSK